MWLVGQAVKTLPSHGRISGSIPLRAAKALKEISVLFLCQDLIYCLRCNREYVTLYMLM